MVLDQKTGKNAIFTVFYGILRQYVRLSEPNVLYNFFWLLWDSSNGLMAKNWVIGHFWDFA